MDKKKLTLLHELLCRTAHIDTAEELEATVSGYTDKLCNNDPLLRVILSDIKNLGEQLVSFKSSDAADNGGKLASLTDKERSELAETERIIDENLFDYHFQPIVNAYNGAIYSYEALMRPKSSLCPSPFHVLKYAELTKRLDEIERATFLNVLDIIEAQKNTFGDKKVFINSIPEASLSEEDLSRIVDLLQKHADTVVVEMTEESELDDDALGRIKDIYRRLNVGIAVDDYGTGYSNVQNLFRYMPNYVKIDRSLVSGIHNDSKKMHFVREIIEFCHDNDIKALAEGVETYEELRTVIHLGADLIQGYYTAKPAADIIDAIPYEIRQEIMTFHQEHVDGKAKHIYTADKAERIVLERLVKDDYDCILVGKTGSGDVTIASTPGTKTKLHIDVANDFNGSITLEHSVLSNIMDRPCISIGENCDVKLVLVGSNQLKNGGIRVPESSKLTICGDGLLSIFVEAAAFYGIGNDADSAHGELIFEQGVSIENYSVTGVCIGSGKGGRISILRGKFNLTMTGTFGVGIGSFDSDTHLYMFACDITLDAALSQGVGLGSIKGNSSTHVHHSSLKLRLSGSDIVGIGTLNGESCVFEIEEASTILNISAQHSSGIAALAGSTSFDINKAAANITVSGERTLAIGGLGGDTSIKMTDADVSVKLGTQMDVMEHIQKDNVLINGGRVAIVVNDVELTAP